jgi:TnpA family transposase
MPKMRILDHAEEQQFENPPKFSNADRKKFLTFPEAILSQCEKIKVPTKKAFFLLTFGYFKAKNKFYPNKFYEKDLKYICMKFSIPFKKVNIKDYDRPTYHHHKKFILEWFGFENFNKDAERLILSMITPLVRSHAKTKTIFFAVAEFLVNRKIEIPSYHQISEIILNAISDHKANLIKTIENALTDEKKELLDSLLEKITDEKTGKEVNRYKLTWLKKFSQSTRPGKIRLNIYDLKTLRNLYKRLEEIIRSLDLSRDGFTFFANSVIKFNYLQVDQKSDSDKYLHLITFIVHQFYRLQDTLIDIFLQAHQTIVNSAIKEEKEKLYKEKEDRRKMISNFIKYLTRDIKSFRKIENIVLDSDLTEFEKIEFLKNILSEEKDFRDRIDEEIKDIRSKQKTAEKDAVYYEILKRKSRMLQNRVSDIIKNVEFSRDSSDSSLIEAIDYYKSRDGKLNGKDVPLMCLFPHEREKVYDEDKKFDISFYKAILFAKISYAIKSGSLNVVYSYKYRSLDDYMIPADEWNRNRSEILKKAEMAHLLDCESVLQMFKKKLDQSFREVNTHAIDGENEHLKFGKKNKFHIITPRKDTEINEEGIAISDYLPGKRYIPIGEVLKSVNDLTGFLDCFEHWQDRYTKKKKPDHQFFAGILGYGCNIGIHKMAKISNMVSEDELNYLVNWNFSLNNILNANDKILEYIDKLELPGIYKNYDNKTITSSDGQKQDISVDSLNANYSYKYFGQKKGVSIYSFIDERHLLFYSTVINAAERDVTFVLDGLMHNNVIQSDMHTTDTHGYSEMMYGTTELLGFEYAPRIKNVRDQQLYAFKSKKEYTSKGYRILPDHKIQETKIYDNWDDILRFVATIKLKVSTASQLFKRLNSYSKQNPLMEALKEYGKIIKTISINKYIDDVERRQLIEGQLNKIESSHRLKKAISFAGELDQATKDEQDIAENCRRLIANAIICWNYVYLSQKLAEETDDILREKMIDVIRNGSVITWQHLNLHGEYDFSEKKIKDSVGFKSTKISSFKILKKREVEKAE